MEAARACVAGGISSLGCIGGKPGTYTITPRAGSPAIARVSTSEPAKLPRISASVSRRGGRRVLSYRIASQQRGQRVTFFERGASSYRKLGTVVGGRGVLSYT